MRHTINLSIIFSVSFVTAWLSVSSVQASLLGSYDFQAVDAGSVTKAILEEESPDGEIWYLNTARSGATYDVESDSGNKALRLDDATTSSGDVQFSTISIKESFALSSLGATDTLDISFQTVSTRTGDNKELLYVVHDGSQPAINIRWYNDGTLDVNGSTTTVDGFTYNSAWTSTARDRLQDVNISIAQDKSYTVTWSGAITESITGNLALDVDNIRRLQTWSGGTAAGKGLYLDNISFEVIPEPTTLGMISLIGIAAAIRRFRKSRV